MFVCGVESEQVKPRLERMFDVDTSPVYSWLCAWGGGGVLWMKVPLTVSVPLWRKKWKPALLKLDYYPLPAPPPHTHTPFVASLFTSVFTLLFLPPPTLLSNMCGHPPAALGWSSSSVRRSGLALEDWRSGFLSQHGKVQLLQHGGDRLGFHSAMRRRRRWASCGSLLSCRGCWWTAVMLILQRWMWGWEALNTKQNAGNLSHIRLFSCF